MRRERKGHGPLLRRHLGRDYAYVLQSRWHEGDLQIYGKHFEKDKPMINVVSARSCSNPEKENYLMSTENNITLL